MCRSSNLSGNDICARISCRDSPRRPLTWDCSRSELPRRSGRGYAYISAGYTELVSCFIYHGYWNYFVVMDAVGLATRPIAAAALDFASLTGGCSPVYTGGQDDS